MFKQIMKMLNISKKEKAIIKVILTGSPVAFALSSDIPIINGNIITTAILWIENNPQKPAKTVIGEIEITRRGIRDDFSHVAFPEKLAVLPVVRNVLEQGAYLGEKQDFRGINIQNYYFAALVVIDGNRKIVFVRVRKKGIGKLRFYIHDIYTLNEIKKSGASKTTGTAQNVQNKGKAPDLYKSILYEVLYIK